MQKRTKFSILFIGTLLLLIFVAFLYAGKWTKELQQFLANAGSVEHAKVNDVVITETKEGEKEWELYAAVAEYDSTNEKAILTDIVGNYYQEKEVVMSFTANKGFYNDKTKKIELVDAVRIVGKDNAELTADKVYWTTTEKTVYAEGEITINNNNELIALCEKATANTEMTFFEIVDNAELRVYKKDKDKRGMR